ncbi:MAG: hypothetical protein AAF417_23030 [Pseudomonadota bacterium]
MNETVVTVGILGLSTVEKAVVTSMLYGRTHPNVAFTLYQLSADRGADVLVYDAASPAAKRAYELYRETHQRPHELIAVGYGDALDADKRLARPLSVPGFKNILRSTATQFADPTSHGVADCEFPDASVLLAGARTDIESGLPDLLRDLVGTVMTAVDGAQASQLLDESVPDVVVLDSGIDAPGPYELARQAKRRGAKAVVMTMAADAPPERKAAQEAGCDTFLIRPINGAILREVVAEYVDEY